MRIHWRRNRGGDRGGRGTRRGLAAIALVAALASCAPAPGGDVFSGRIDAAAIAPLPAGAPFSLAVEGDGPTRAALIERLRRLLVARGHGIDANAPHVLSFRVITVAAGGRASLPEVGLAGVIGSSGTRDVGVSIDLPILGLGGAPRNRYRYVAEIELRDRAGALVWRGRVDGLAATRDADRIAARVLPPLLDRLGQTVRGEGLRPPS